MIRRMWNDPTKLHLTSLFTFILCDLFVFVLSRHFFLCFNISRKQGVQIRIYKCSDKFNIAFLCFCFRWFELVWVERKKVTNEMVLVIKPYFCMPLEIVDKMCVTNTEQSNMMMFIMIIIIVISQLPDIWCETSVYFHFTRYI